MKFHSTNKQSKGFSFEEALLAGLAPDGGLFMPDRIPRLPQSFFSSLPRLTFAQIAQQVSSLFIDSVPGEDLRKIINESFNFPIPLRKLYGNLFVLELFHGPTMAFKDFGARFMARVMGHFIAKQEKGLKIVVATSGDTGSAVTSGFYQVPNIEVYILFPSGKVSPLQEKQLTTYRGNITAIEVKGSFDDCQRLAKQVLSDLSRPAGRRGTLSSSGEGRVRASSANSINFGRLLPQSFYYFWAYAQLKKITSSPYPLPPKGGRGEKGGPVIVVPSGNFGNLTAGLLARKMGLPVSRFIAATNANGVVPKYLKTGRFRSKKSKQTISNAMDVGNPSNFARMLEIYKRDYRLMRKDIAGISVSERQTKKTIKKIYEDTGYILDPHTAVGVAAAERFCLEKPTIVLATAHPAKFSEIVEPIIGKKLAVPARLQAVLKKKSKSIIIENDLGALKRAILPFDL